MVVGPINKSTRLYTASLTNSSLGSVVREKYRNSCYISLHIQIDLNVEYDKLS